MRMLGIAEEKKTKTQEFQNVQVSTTDLQLKLRMKQNSIINYFLFNFTVSLLFDIKGIHTPTHTCL